MTEPQFSTKNIRKVLFVIVLAIMGVCLVALVTFELEYALASGIESFLEWIGLVESGWLEKHREGFLQEVVLAAVVTFFIAIILFLRNLWKD
ncbi:hypothetical protein [Emcibacter nanhaiensis]|uniref:Uncharacterized protein n=1 Tax=Emcibacter nanhaiensis TaxID=1505037 RepID=A0A501PC75_9PROT|nr:hypothetical protein [Emcibacter nanhaiensis]TPD57825.1 hypothetical protein FIV46_17125 [Emcibacter nanhaiensis]